MKYTVLTIILLLITAACANKETDENKIRINKKTVLIDVRTKQEFESGHLENSINIPYTEIVKKISATIKDKNAYIVVYCRSGRRSGIAKKMLEDIGYKNVINGGGYTDLKKQLPARTPKNK